MNAPNSILPDYWENTEIPHQRSPGGGEGCSGGGGEDEGSNEIRVEGCWFPGYRNRIIGTSANDASFQRTNPFKLKS